MTTPYMFRDSSSAYSKQISSLFTKGALDEAETMLEDIWRTAGAERLLETVRLPSLAKVAAPIVKVLAKPWNTAWELDGPFNAIVFALEVELDMPFLRVFGAHEERGELQKELEYLNLYLTQDSDNGEDPYALNGLWNEGAFPLKYKRTFVAGKDAYHHLKTVQFAKALRDVFNTVTTSKAFVKNVSERPFTCWLEPHHSDRWPALPIATLATPPSAARSRASPRPTSRSRSRRSSR